MLTLPSLQWRLLGSVKEEIRAEPVREWPREAIDFCSTLLQKSREAVVGMRLSLEEALAKGVEASLFARDGNRLLTAAKDRAALIQELAESLSSATDTASERIVAELRLLEREEKAYRDLLAEAVSLAARPSRPLAWDRIRLAEEACARGETKPFFRR
jgi:hypothetical protein